LIQTLYSLNVCSINTNLDQYTTKNAGNICQDELIDYLLENNSSNGKYKTFIAPNRTEDNPIYFAISIEKIVLYNFMSLEKPIINTMKSTKRLNI